MTNRRRAGKRKDRNAELGKRVPNLGYYLIVTDTRCTEQNYFLGLRDSIPEAVRNHLVIRVEEAKTTQQLLQYTIELRENLSQYCQPWIVFDRDEVPDFDNMIQNSQKRGIQVGWSNPCFEIWFHAYFGSMPVFMNSQACWKAISVTLQKRTGKKYIKNDPAIYRKLSESGDVHTAIRIAKKRYEEFIEANIQPSRADSVTTAYQLVEEILEKIE